ncbi:MAG: hypothetical protein ACYS8X_08535 [Planctomycetota bacterium]|jgi:hypothetical protein
MESPATVHVKPVSSRADLRHFKRLPRKLRGGQDGWIEPLKLTEGQILDRRRHPFYDNGRGAEAEFFLARDRRGRPIGRIAAIINHRYDAVARQDGEFNKPTGFFGFFDCVESASVAEALLATAKDWLRARGREMMLGPASPSEAYEYGLLVEGHDQPHRFLCAYQPAYYRHLLERAGLVKAKDLLGMSLDLQAGEGAEKMERFLEFVDEAAGRSEDGISVRSPDIANFETEIRTVCALFNRTLGRLWGHCPLSQQELGHVAWSLRRLAYHDGLVIAEHEGRPVGVALTVPDLNEVIRRLRFRWATLEPLELLWRVRRHKPTYIRVLVLGVEAEYGRSLVVPALVGELARNLLARGIGCIDAHLVLEDNASILTPLRRYGFRADRRYRIYQCDV